MGRLCPRSCQAPRSWQPRGAAGGVEGEGRGPVPLRGVAVTQRALFFAGERDRPPEGEIQGEGPPGRRGLQQTAPKQPSGWSEELTKSSTMGEYGVRVADTRRAVAGGSVDPAPEQRPLKLSSGAGLVGWPLCGHAGHGSCRGRMPRHGGNGVFFPKVILCPCVLMRCLWGQVPSPWLVPPKPSPHRLER